MKKISQLAIILEGGIVQSVISDNPDLDLVVAVVDYDTSDCDDTENMQDITQYDGTTSKAYIVHHEIGHAGIDLEEIFGEAPMTDVECQEYSNIEREMFNLTVEGYNQRVINQIFADDGLITAEMFKEATGCDPVDDDLDRCNCSQAGQLMHSCCGWNEEHNKPQFYIGPVYLEKWK